MAELSCHGSDWGNFECYNLNVHVRKMKCIVRVKFLNAHIVSYSEIPNQIEMKNFQLFEQR
jgi:hypothetical protein